MNPSPPAAPARTAVVPAGQPLTERLRLLAATLALAVLAVAGNHYHITLCFGVEIIFGSIAALLALVWLGTWPGLLVAAAGGGYTLWLWGHPWALLIFCAEAATCAWLLARARRRGTPPNLGLMVAAYWLLLGIPLVLLCYRYAIGMPWRQTGLIAFKQSQNGILNASLAALIVLAVALARRRPASLSAREVLFSLLLAALLVPSLALVSWQNRDLKAQLETQLNARLTLFAQLATHDLTGAHPPDLDHAGLALHLDELGDLLASSLQVSTRPRLTLVPVADAPAATPTTALQPLLPAAPMARMQQWRAAWYRLDFPLGAPLAGQMLRLEVPAAPLVDQLQETSGHLLALLFGLTLLGLVAAAGLSRLLTAPLQRLAALAASVPRRVLAGHPARLDLTDPIGEYQTLATALQAMSTHLAAGLGAVAAERDAEARRRRLADLQTGLLTWLSHAAGDEQTAATLLCQQLDALLPGQHAALLLPTAAGDLQILAAPGLDASTHAALGASLQTGTGGAGCHQQAFEQGSPQHGAAVAGALPDCHCVPIRDATGQILGVLSLLAAPRSGADPNVELSAGPGAGPSLAQPPDHRSGRCPASAPATDPAAASPATTDAAHFSTQALTTAAALAALVLTNLRLRRRHEELLQALSASEASQREFAETIGEVFWRFDVATSRITYVSAAFATIWERPAAAVLADPEVWLASIHPADAPAMRARLAALQTIAGPLSSEYRIRTPSGHEKWLLDRAYPVRTAAGRLVRVIGVTSDISARKAVELDLLHRERLDQELLALAAQLVNLPVAKATPAPTAPDSDAAPQPAPDEAPDQAPNQTPDQTIDQAIEQMLGRIGRFMQVDRTYLFSIDHTAGLHRNTHEWTAPGIAPMRERLQALPFAGAPRALAHMQHGQPLVVERVAELPAAWAAERTLLLQQSIQSLLLVPLFQQQELIGYAGFDAVRAPRRWSDPEQRFLHVFANLLVGALTRARDYQALHESNQRYDLLARQTRTMAWETDADGYYTYVSPVSELLLGRPPRTLLGRHCSDLCPPSERAQMRAEATAMLAAGRPIQDYANPLQHADGHTVWCLTDGLPIFTADRTLCGYRGTDRDITAQHEAQARLRASEAQLAAVFENAPIGIALIGPDAHIASANRALADFLGRGVDTLIGMRVEDLTHPQDIGADQALFAEVLAGKRKSYRLTKRYLHADGRVIWGDLRLALLPPPRPGAPPIPLGMVEDITEYQHESARRQALERQLAAYTASLEALLDLSNRPLAAREESRQLLQLGCQRLGMRAAVLARIDADGRTLRRIASSTQDGSRLPLGHLRRPLLRALLTAPGQPRLLGAAELPASLRAQGLACGIACGLVWPGAAAPEADLVLAFWGHGECAAVSGPQRDLVRLIGQRIAAVQFEASLQGKLVQAKERETIGHLASGVAHDFNNLLGVIDANLHFLHASLGPAAASDGSLEAAVDLDQAEVATVLTETQSALDQAKVVTSGMLALSRAGGVPLESVDLQAAVSGLLGVLRQVLPAAIRLTLDLTPGLVARSNAGFLQAALLNLALNARDAMPDGGTLRIGTRVRHWPGQPALAIGQLAPGTYLELQVSDTGCGMTSAVRARIFEPLFSTKARQRGHGLGMFMVAEFIGRADAGLILETAPGRGSRFRLLLPSAPPARAAAAALSTPHLPPLRVLLVDDDALVRAALGRLLERQGMRVQLATNGAEALAVLAADAAFDLVLSDLSMPVLDGVGLWQALQTEHPGLPLILMTGLEDPGRPELTASGAPPVLRKPIEIAVLQRTIARLGIRL